MTFPNVHLVISEVFFFFPTIMAKSLKFEANKQKPQVTEGYVQLDYHFYKM